MIKLRVLLIDDEPDVRAATAQSLDLAGFTVQAVSSGERALELVGFGFLGIILSDIRMPAMDGLTLMTRVHEVDCDIPVILLTGHADVQLAVRAMHEGAFDFIEKPFDSGKLAKVIARALDYRRLVLENRSLRAAASQRDDLEQRLLGRSAGMVDLRRRIRTIGPSDADVLIVGETGAGKGIAARALHDTSPRAQRPFITIDCAALPAALMESELFGHEAGAFAGAHRARFGKFEHARGGTVLLDDIASLPLEMQGKLLRVIETRAITRLGSHDAVPLDLRFLATTRVPLEAEVRAGRFRSDLLYRLNVVTLHLPSLAARRDDIALLFLHLLAEAARRHETDPAPPNAALIAQITSSDWPGNVRELRNAADRYALGIIETQPNMTSSQDRLAMRVAKFERREIEAALAAHNGHLRKVYEALGISRKTLYEKIQKHGLERDFLSGDHTDD